MLFISVNVAIFSSRTLDRMYKTESNTKERNSEKSILMDLKDCLVVFPVMEVNCQDLPALFDKKSLFIFQTYGFVTFP